jgi:hypothetical protein
MSWSSVTQRSCFCGQHLDALAFHVEKLVEHHRSLPCWTGAAGIHDTAAPPSRARAGFSETAVPCERISRFNCAVVAPMALAVLAEIIAPKPFHQAELGGRDLSLVKLIAAVGHGGHAACASVRSSHSQPGDFIAMRT